MKITSVVAKRFGNYQTKPSVLYGVIGDLSTSIIEVPNKTSMIYVTLEHSGIVLPNILNVRVPNLLGTRVKIGFDPITFPGILQVLGIRDLYYKDVDNPGIGPVWHHKQHEWPNPDAVYSRGEQLLPSMYYPIAGTLTAGIYPNAYRLSTGWKVVDQITIVSLAASVASITSGNAMCALIVVDDSGTFVARPGALVAEQASPFISAYMMLTDADIPEPVAGDHTICGVKLYYGQTTLRCNGNVNDFIDLRFSGASGGGSGGHIIMDEGEALPAEPNLDFAGDGVTVTDVPGDSKSLVTIPGSAGDVTGPDTNTDNYIPQWDGADSKALKDGLLLVTSVGSPGDDTSIATEKAIRTAINALIGAMDAWVYKGAINCSTNPNYPAADCGHTYKVSAAGRIGGASGAKVEVNDIMICTLDGSPAGDQATVGANWDIFQANIDGAVIGPASATDGHMAVFDGLSGKIVKDGGAPGGGGGHTIQEEGSPLTQRTNLNFVGGGVTATDDAGNDATVVTIPSGAYAATIGDNSNTEFTVTHTLGSEDVVVELWDLTGSDPVLATGDASAIEVLGIDSIKVTFAAPPATDSYRVVILMSGGGGGGGGGGDVYGDAAATDEHLAVFDMDGYHIKDGGAVPTGSGMPATKVYAYSNFI